MRDNPNQVSKDFTSRFEKLSFKDDVDISGYREALDYAFSNPDIKILLYLALMDLEKVAF